MPPLRPAAQSFRDLLVWRKAHEFVVAIYTFTDGFPRQETYGLALQMRRAAVSIVANIAEGFRRRGKADKARFMNLAEGRWRNAVIILFWPRILGMATLSRWAGRRKKSAECSPPMPPPFWFPGPNSVSCLLTPVSFLSPLLH